MLPTLTARVRRSDVPAAVRRPANAGRYWAALPFDDLLTAVAAFCRRAGWGPGEWTVHLSRNGGDIAASAPVPGADRGVGGWRLVPCVGVVASNLRRRTLTIFGGVRASRTGGAAVLFRHKSLHRHTGSVSPTEQVRRFFAFSHNGQATAHAGFARMTAAVRALREDRMTPARIERALHGAGRARLMPWSRVGRVEDLLGDRKFMHGRRGCSAWDLVEAFGVISECGTPVGHMDRLYEFYRLVAGKAVGAV